MKNILKLGILMFAAALIFISTDTVNAQTRSKVRKERREYREDVRDARQDYRRRVNNGDYRKARREYREDVRDARKDYRHDTGRRYNNRYYNNRNRNVYQQRNRANPYRTRVYYRNGRRYVVRY